MHVVLLVAVVLLTDAPAPPICADTVPTLELSRLTPESAAPLIGRPGRFAFVPGSRPGDVAGSGQVGAEGPPGCLRVVAFDPGEDDEGLDVLAPQVVEGVLVLIRHPARGAFPSRPSCRCGPLGGCGRAREAAPGLHSAPDTHGLTDGERPAKGPRCPGQVIVSRSARHTHWFGGKEKLSRSSRFAGLSITLVRKDSRPLADDEHAKLDPEAIGPWRADSPRAERPCVTRRASGPDQSGPGLRLRPAVHP
jgi:hypothetical protein